ncbi:hypothetical protein K4K61_006135 [Colletotrichum sp. SAR11_59]|nr:hypothetical protein K4K61_006135 [Colletotrichum sp. SAR11_59]
MSPQNTFTFLLTLAAGAAAGRVQYRQVDCSTTTTLDALTVTRVEPISIYILPEQQQQQPTGFTTTHAVCNDGPTPVTAVLTVPQETDAVVTVTVEEVITEPGLTTTRLVTKTCANGPCLPDITAAAIPGADRLTINGGTIVLPVTVTKTETDKTTATEKETATVTTTSDSNEFNPNGFNSGAGHMIPSHKSMVFAMSAFALLFLLSA